MKKKIKIKGEIIAVVFIIILIILMFVYGNIIQKSLGRRNFVKRNMEIYQNNEQSVFNIEKIIVCSSANAIDLSQEKNLQDLSIYQYTDIAIYINNGEELSNKNTVKELYIDNISINGVDGVGSKSLNYKNLLNFGLKEDITEKKETSDIKFNIVYTNNENEQANYNDPTFFTDCSNPISLEYLNYDVLKNYKMDQNKAVAFDGNILEDAKIPTENLACNLKFKINIVNNDNNKYNCWANIDIPLDDIYKGTTMKAKTTNGNKYVFFRE